MLKVTELRRSYVLVHSLSIHCWRRSTARGFSLVNIRILTGRMHQTLTRADSLGGACSLTAFPMPKSRIRLHTAHVGHPTVRDGKYTPNATFEARKKCSLMGIPATGADM